MELRKAIFWLHLCLALGVGAVVVVMAGTGVLLAFQPQIIEWADLRGLEDSAPAPATARVPLDTLIARAAAEGVVTGLRIRADPAAPAELQLGRDRALFANRHTGEIVGSTRQSVRAFFAAVTDLHRWLALDGTARRTGRAVTGAANVAFMFIVLSGLLLWLPRNRTTRSFRSVLLFRRGLRAKARDFNWHNVTGIWCALPLLLIIASGVVISYAWAGAVVERLSGEDVSAAQNRIAIAPQGTSPALTLQQDTSLPLTAGQDASAALSAEQLLAIAERKVEGWRTITMALPPRGGARTFVIDRGREGQPHKRAELVLSSTGAELRWLPFADEPRPQRVRSILRYLHTGEVLGVVGQTIAGAVSAAVLLLAWTGVSLALRRLRSWRRRSALPEPPT